MKYIEINELISTKFKELDDFVGKMSVALSCDLSETKYTLLSHELSRLRPVLIMLDSESLKPKDSRIEEIINLKLGSMSLEHATEEDENFVPLYDVKWEIPVLVDWLNEKGFPVPKPMTEWMESIYPILACRKLVTLLSEPQPEKTFKAPTKPPPGETWSFLPKQEPARAHAKLYLKGAVIALAERNKGELEHGGHLSATQIAARTLDLSTKWWKRQGKDTLPGERTMAKHISSWLKAGQPDPETAP